MDSFLKTCRHPEAPILPRIPGIACRFFVEGLVAVGGILEQPGMASRCAISVARDSACLHIATVVVDRRRVHRAVAFHRRLPRGNFIKVCSWLETQWVVFEPNDEAVWSHVKRAAWSSGYEASHRHPGEHTRRTAFYPMFVFRFGPASGATAPTTDCRNNITDQHTLTDQRRLP